MNSLRGMIFTILVVLGVAGYAAIDRTTNFQSAKATVFLIDRMCKFDRKYSDGKRETVTQSCNTTEEFASISGGNGKRRIDVDGKAMVKVSYTAPQDGSYRTSELRFDGRDDEFYALKAGDEIDILVSNEDPTKIRKS